MQQEAKDQTESYLRIWQIIGCKRRGIPPLVPVCKNTWESGSTTGRFPPKIRLGPNVVVWRSSEIYALLRGEWRVESDR